MNHKDANDKREESLWYRRPVIWFGVFVIVAWLMTLAGAGLWGSAGGGTFGDTFGSINALFSGLAFVGLIYAILLQREELGLQRQELVQTRVELKGTREAQEAQNAFIARQTFESTFFQLVRNFNDIIESIDLRVDGNTTAKGRDAIQVFYQRLSREVVRLRDLHDGRDALQLVCEAYERFYENHGHELGHYYRTLYNLIKFVDTSNLHSEDKRSYVQLVRAQLSDFEVNLLFYNSLSERAKAMKILVDRYHLLRYANEKHLFFGGNKTFHNPAAFSDPPREQ